MKLNLVDGKIKGITLKLVGTDGLYETEDLIKNIKVEDFYTVKSLKDVQILAGNAKLYSDNLEEATDFIEPLQEFTSQEDELSSGDILETRSASTPTVPVYDADIPQEDIVMSDPLEQGDSVVHAKYGNGVVEKMINYGTKTLYSINFENVGRRLLDPSITEIKKA